MTSNHHQNRLYSSETAEFGRRRATLVVAALVLIILGGVYFWVAGTDANSVKNLVASTISGLMVGLVAFVAVLTSKGLGLWRRTDKLDAVFEFVEGQRRSLADQIRVFDNYHDVHWNSVLAGSGPLRFFGNFATLPLRQGRSAVGQALQSGSGHVFVVLDPIDNEASLALLADARQHLDFANSSDGIEAAVRESVALLLDLLPEGDRAIDRPILGVRVILAKQPTSFVSYGGASAIVISGHEVLPTASAGPTPRILLEGIAADRCRTYIEAKIADLLDTGDGREPTLGELVNIAGPVRNEAWALRVRRRISSTV